MAEFPKKPDRSELYGYKLQLALGQGGTGTVYRGVDPDTSQIVAMKLLRANFFRNKLHRRELAKNVKKFEKLDHPNVVKVLDYITGDEGDVIIMEFVDGPDLKWYLDERPFNLQERLVLLAQICNGLSYIHEAGYIHHDMKPANVLFTRKGQAKLCDFSLAGSAGMLSILDRGMAEQITPMFVSPEVISKSKITKQSDLYSLGVMMYIMFTGKVPFEVDDLQRLYACHLQQMPFHPSEVSETCPRNLGDIIMRLMAKKPSERFADCHELRIALGEIGQSRI
jgi:eukaryotic-like serine/threonine-protein kinase